MMECKSEAQRVAGELELLTQDVLDMAEAEAARADELEAVLREAAACNFGPGEWREKARRLLLASVCGLAAMF